jgi:hypothetical protein
MKAFFACAVSLIFLCGSVSSIGQTVSTKTAPISADPTHRMLGQPATSSVMPDGELLIKVQPIGSLKLDNGASAPWWTYLIPILGPILSGALAFVGVVLGLRIAAVNTSKTTESAQKNTEASIWQKANETELRDIQAKLDGFYIPFQLQSKANHQFAQDIRSRQRDKEYRMLTKLFDAEWRKSLTPGDAKLVEIVCSNAEDLRALIANKSGLVDDQILPHLSRASAHFRILNLAFKSELGSDAAQFEKYVYPRQLDPVLALEITRLKSRIDQLRSNPSVCPPPAERLKIPSSLELPEWVDPDGRLKGEVVTATLETRAK